MCSDFQFSFFYTFFRFRIPKVTERLKRDSEGRTLTSNLVYTIWAVFGGFILHFLLCNFLTVLLTPSYEEPVDTAKDVIKRDITPFYWPAGDIMRQILAASSDPINQEISKKLVTPKDEMGLEDWNKYFDMVHKVTSTGMYALIGTLPHHNVPEEEYKDWYRSTETISGTFPYAVHLSNKNGH